MLRISLHALLDPGPRLSGQLLSSRLILNEFLDSMRRRHMTALLDALTSSHALLPSLQMRELLDVHAGPARGSNPTPVRDISNADVVADQIAGLGGGKVLVQHAVQTTGLVDITVDAVLDALGRIAGEVVGLALHGTNTGILEVQPAVHLVILTRTSRVGDLVVLVVLFHQVGENAAGLEDADLLAISEGVGDGGDPAIGVDFEEPAGLGGQWL